APSPTFFSPLSLHDALPIFSVLCPRVPQPASLARHPPARGGDSCSPGVQCVPDVQRSRPPPSTRRQPDRPRRRPLCAEVAAGLQIGRAHVELQSLAYLVCRL